jgi:aryl-alcohol dehydrogenase-like predicted oxidoreductase
MEKRRIGLLEVSLVGLGCNNFGWRIDAAQTAQVVEACLESGVTFFDTADFYGAGQSEEFLGRALAGAKRQQAVIATKFGLKMGDGREGGGAAYVKQAVEASLKRLGTDYIDLYQLHRPDEKTPIAETLGALDDLVRAGKVREIGCSNFTAEMIGDAATVSARAGGARFVSVQNHYSLMHREPEQGVLAECEARGMGLLPFFPLESGLLTGKYHYGVALPEGSRGKDGFGPKVYTDDNLKRADSLGQYARQQGGHSLLELAFAYLAAQRAVASIIAGAKDAEQVRTNAQAAAWRLTPEQVAVARALAG